eukprot:TRINITY_DN692_c0_g2_i1.p1 TRINITY_DN692_c0_g2~~TRINITY_DN692_c0_g2_i1.p1  ORF type:complete len:1230 (-),score=332.21 TRINITY_DN692_c0_g2_i1:54-3488(-)
MDIDESEEEEEREEKEEKAVKSVEKEVKVAEEEEEEEELEEMLFEDLVLEIFRNLSRMDLFSCAQVSKRWYHVSHSPELAWTSLTSSTFALHLQDAEAWVADTEIRSKPLSSQLASWASAPVNDLKSISPPVSFAPRTPDIDIVAAHIALKGNNQGRSYFANSTKTNFQKTYEFFNESKESVGCYRVTTLTGVENAKMDELMANLLKLADDHPRLVKKKITTWNGNVSDFRPFRAWGQQQPVNFLTLQVTVTISVEFFINPFFLQSLVQKKEPIPFRVTLAEFVATKIYGTNRRSRFHGYSFGRNAAKAVTAEPANVPCIPAPLKQAPGFVEKIKLHKYQLDAVSWMKSVEEGRKIQFCDLAAWSGSRSSLLFDFRSSSFKLLDDIKDRTFFATSRGGVLGDEMGLGKTTEIMGLALANPPPEDAPDMSQYKKVDAFDKFYTGATLVICPNHLAVQWKEEIHNHTDPQLNVVLLTTRPQHKAYTYQDIIDADFVIVSTNFMKNKGYFMLGGSSKKAVKVDLLENRRNWVASKMRAIHKKGNPFATKSPILDHFVFHRFVIDEAHEALVDHFSCCYYKEIESEFRWYVTGTPFPSRILYPKVAEFVDLKSPVFDTPQSEIKRSYGYGDLSPLEAHNAWLLKDLIGKRFTWRHTKESSNSNKYVPNFVEEHVVVNFTPAERCSYLDANNEFQQRRVCTEAPVYLPLKQQKKKQSPLNSMIVAMFQQFRRYVGRTTVADITKEIADLDRNYQRQNRNDANAKSRFTYAKRRLEQQLEKHMQALDSFRRWRACNALPVPPRLRDDYSHSEYSDWLSKNLARQKKLNEIKAQAKKEKNGHDGGEEEEKAKDDKEEKKNKEKKGEEDEDEDYDSDLRYNSEGEVEGEEAILEWTVAKRVGSLPLPGAPSLSRSKSSLALQEKQTSIRELVFRFGTKLGNLLFYIQKTLDEDEENRLIIFSQFSSALTRLNNLLLEEFDIESSFVEGNVMRKNKALRQFKGDSSTRVIMLSLAKAASGTNLMAASHVILLDPVFGTKKEALATESQAIGRAHRQGQTRVVTVVRFIIRDTVEHEVFLRNNNIEATDDLDDEQAQAAKPSSSPSPSPSLAPSQAQSLRRNRAILARSGSLTSLLASSGQSGSSEKKFFQYMG